MEEFHKRNWKLMIGKSIIIALKEKDLLKRKANQRNQITII